MPGHPVVLRRDADRATWTGCATSSTRPSTPAATPGYEWELASALQMRANVLANRGRLGGRRDPGRRRGAGDLRAARRRCGAPPRRSPRAAEAHERRASARRAAADYAERDRARRTSSAPAPRVPVLSARLGGVLLEAGDGRARRAAAARGASTSAATAPATRPMPACPAVPRRLARPHAAAVPEAREQLRLLRAGVRASRTSSSSTAFMLGVGGLAGRGRRAATRSALTQAAAGAGAGRRPAGRGSSPRTCAPCTCTTAAARPRRRLDGGARARDARPLLGAADALLPPGHFPTSDRSAPCAAQAERSCGPCSATRRTRRRTPRAAASPWRRPPPWCDAAPADAVTGADRPSALRAELADRDAAPSTAVIAADQASVTHRSCATGPPTSAPRAASARWTAGCSR